MRQKGTLILGHNHGYCRVCKKTHELPASDEAIALARALIPCVREALDGDKGCMIGVLIGQDSRGRKAALKAYSGTKQLTGLEIGWAPPTRAVDATLREEADTFEKLNELSAQIKALRWPDILAQLDAAKAQFELDKNRLREEKNEKRAARRIRRAAALDDPETLHRLEQESWDESVAYRRALKDLKAPVHDAKARYDTVLGQMTTLKKRRRALSNRLQLSFNQEHNLTNFCGYSLPLENAHINPANLVPGTGECAAPKLLQDAARRGLQPSAMAEVWVGDSLADPIRIEGNVYPPCEERCHPILGHMLCGAADPSALKSAFDLELLSETNDWIAIDKPGRLLAAPGRGHDKIDSVVTRVRHFYARGADARAAHRLDYETSGLMLIALHAQAQAAFHRLFLDGAMEKWYLAWLETVQSSASGRIRLPLSGVEGGGRQQCVSSQGKDAISDYTVLGEHDGGSLILFRPRTGRTHQLRVHASDASGLENPIRGDDLYGHAGETLFLHAWRLSFAMGGSDSKTTIWCPLPEQWPEEIIELARQTKRQFLDREIDIF